MTARELLLRLKAWLRRDELSRELQHEMQMHVDLLARDLERDGLPPDEALAAARRQIGNITIQREASRDHWGFPRFDAVLQDLRYAVRSLTRSSGFTAVVVLTLGLGIGANAAMFAVIDRLMFRPFPLMRDPHTVHRAYFQVTSGGARRTWATVPYTRYLDLQRETHSFSLIAASSEWRLAVGTGPDTRVRKVAGVSASFFDFFDAPPARGRYFSAAEDVTPLGALVAVLGHGYWQSELASSDVLGTQLQIGSLVYTIIGVAAKDFVGTVSGHVPEIFIPVTTVPANLDPGHRSTYFTQYNWDWMEILLRRKPGVSAEAASADLTMAYRRSRAAQRVLNPRVLPDSVAQPRALAGAVRIHAAPDAGLESRVLLWVTGVAAIVLIIACANVANLMLARLMRRRREIAVRLALGVRRRRLVAQFLMEGMLLAVLGAVAGMFAAQWGGIGIRRLLLPEGSSFALGSDWRTIMVAGVCALVAALLTTLGPALLTTGSPLSEALKAGVREGTNRRSRARSALVILQGTLSVVLLVGAGLFVRSLNNVLAIPLGYDATTVLQVHIDFRSMPLDSAQRVRQMRRLLAAAQAIPGVEAAARANARLFATSTVGLKVPGIDSVERLGRFNIQIASSDYFRVMRTRILRGRGFAEGDGEATQRVTVVSNSMARVLWPGKDPLGQCIQVQWNPMARVPTTECITVVGVADDAAQQGITDEQRFMYYLNIDQIAPSWITQVLVRMRGDDIDHDLERVRRAMQAAMPGDGFVVVRPLQEVVDNQRRSWQLGATLFAAFGGLALIVAAIGLYGVIAYNVTQRLHELGVRVALGARTFDIVRLVVRQGVFLALSGVVVGLALALLGAPWLEPLLYKLSARDPRTYAGVGLITLAVALVASAVPAIRAARADPNMSLRSD